MLIFFINIYKDLNQNLPIADLLSLVSVLRTWAQILPHGQQQ